MKQMVLDITKWAVILIIAGAVVYVIQPKYHFQIESSNVHTKGNRITGKVELFDPYFNKWLPMPRKARILGPDEFTPYDPQPDVAPTE